MWDETTWRNLSVTLLELSSHVHVAVNDLFMLISGERGFHSCSRLMENWTLNILLKLSEIDWMCSFQVISLSMLNNFQLIFSVHQTNICKLQYYLLYNDENLEHCWLSTTLLSADTWMYKPAILHLGKSQICHSRWTWVAWDAYSIRVWFKWKQKSMFCAVDCYFYSKIFYN